jgi:hypothetical protein
MTDLKKPAGDVLPKWLTVTAESAVVQLTKAYTMNGIQVDKVTMRSPTLKESRASQAEHPKDDNAAEMLLFTGLCEVPEKELELLSVVDYMRLQRGYFRLVTEDEV